MIHLKPATTFIAILLFFSEALPQTFTKIIDPTNPVVTDQFESGGGCWVDINSDGYLDLFVANGNQTSQPNSLYLNNRSGNFIKVVSGSVITDSGSSIGGTFGDYDNDGKLDLFVTNRQPAIGPLFGNSFYRGNGDTIFTRINTGAPATDRANSNSSSWVDINSDGYLDLCVVNFQANNFLYYNSGPPGYSFTRVDTGGIVLDAANFSIPGAWADYNNDRKPDLFIGNSGSQNDVLFTNGGNGRFSQTAFSDGRATLGSSWGDFDNDGDLDLFVANFLGQNNILYRNSGPPSYTLVPIDTGIVSNDGGNSVGSVFADFDNDGDVDLFVANDGIVGENNVLYLNSGPPLYSFSKVTTGIVVNDGGNSFGCAAADYDNDGDIDLFVANRLNQRNFLYSNDGNANKWLSVTCVGVASNRSGIGTKVRVKAIISGNSYWQTREVLAQTGYNSQTLALHFGCGNATTVDSIKVEWPSGATEVFTNQQTNRNMTFVEGLGPTDVAEEYVQSPERITLEQNYPNPFNPTTTIRFSIGTYGHTSLRVFDLLGKEVATLVNEEMKPGSYERVFSVKGLASGVYVFRLSSSGQIKTRRMTIVK